ncbi:hypothetical protein ALAU109921_14190 [Alteromonas australica]
MRFKESVMQAFLLRHVCDALHLSIRPEKTGTELPASVHSAIGAFYD